MCSLLIFQLVSIESALISKRKPVVRACSDFEGSPHKIVEISHGKYPQIFAAERWDVFSTEVNLSVVSETLQRSRRNLSNTTNTCSEST